MTAARNGWTIEFLSLVAFLMASTVFAADYEQHVDFGVKEPGDVVSFTVTPPGKILTGTVVNPGPTAGHWQEVWV